MKIASCQAIFVVRGGGKSHFPPSRPLYQNYNNFTRCFYYPVTIFITSNTHDTAIPPKMMFMRVNILFSLLSIFDILLHWLTLSCSTLSNRAIQPECSLHILFVVIFLSFPCMANYPYRNIEHLQDCG